MSDVVERQAAPCGAMASRAIRAASVAVPAALAFLAALTTSRTAAASGFSTQHFGGEEGSVVATNPTALYYNPGAMGFSDGIHLYLDGDIAFRSATWTHTATLEPGQAANTQYGNTGKASAFNVFAGPALGMTIQIGDHLVVGGGLFVPFGGRVHFNGNSSIPTSAANATEVVNGQTVATNAGGLCSATPQTCPLAAAGVQRWHIDTASLTFLYATVGAALKFGPVSFGVTGNFINSQIQDTQSHTQSGAIDATQEQLATLSVEGNNGSFGAGLMVEILPKHLYFGASYQAQPGLGAQTLKGNLNYNPGPLGYYSQTSYHWAVDFHQSLPDIVRAGLKAELGDKVELRLFGDLTRWSVMVSQCINQAQDGNQCSVYGSTGNGVTMGQDSTSGGSVLTNIPRNWKNTYGARLGASWWLRPEVEIFAGVGYETAAAPDATLEPGAMDANNLLASLGGRVRVAKDFYFAASYTQIQFLPRTVNDSALEQYATPSFTQSGNGQYSQWIGFVDINAEKKF
jgi:long-chain fatty acid transport protein